VARQRLGVEYCANLHCENPGTTGDRGVITLARICIATYQWLDRDILCVWYVSAKEALVATYFAILAHEFLTNKLFTTETTVSAILSGCAWRIASPTIDGFNKSGISKGRAPRSRFFLAPFHVVISAYTFIFVFRHLQAGCTVNVQTFWTIEVLRTV
jgi:hypothetical protein